MNTLRHNQKRIALTYINARAIGGYNLSYNSKGKRNHSQRIGKDYRTWFGFLVVVPE